MTPITTLSGKRAAKAKPANVAPVTLQKPNRAARRQKEPTYIKLDIACGQNKQPGFVGIDFAACEGVDIVHDLTVAPWPIEADSVEYAHCSHFVEHLTGDQMMAFMNELHRVMKPGAQCFILTPYYTSMRAVQDPTHRQFMSEANFLYYNKAWREQNRLDHYPITCDFDFSYGYGFDAAWGSRSDEARAFALRHYWNVALDLHVTITKREG